MDAEARSSGSRSAGLHARGLPRQTKVVVGTVGKSFPVAIILKGKSGSVNHPFQPNCGLAAGNRASPTTAFWEHWVGLRKKSLPFPNM